MNLQTGNKVRKAVLPVAGLGTRFLPATKAQPKEMLPVVDKPLIQYAVEECVAAGIEHVVLVTGRGKDAIEDHFDASPELENFLERRGRQDLAELVRSISNLARFSYTRQKEPLGLGHAVLSARDLVGEEPFAVLLGDVILAGSVVATRQLMDLYAETGSGVLTVVEVPREDVSRYGIIEPAETRQWLGRTIYRIRDLVEKPSPEEAPSSLAVVGRYVLPAAVFGALEQIPPGRGGEIQLTDALRVLAQQGELWAIAWEGKAYDAGDKLGFLQATVEMALQNPELGPPFRAYLRSLQL
jgi:UTP--glucose-1-phosphate uridylyltransferase